MRPRRRQWRRQPLRRRQRGLAATRLLPQPSPHVPQRWHRQTLRGSPRAAACSPRLLVAPRLCRTSCGRGRPLRRGSRCAGGGMLLQLLLLLLLLLRLRLLLLRGPLLALPFTPALPLPPILLLPVPAAAGGAGRPGGGGAAAARQAHPRRQGVAAHAPARARGAGGN